MAEKALPGATIILDVYSILNSQLVSRSIFQDSRVRSTGNTTLKFLAERCIKAKNIEGAAHLFYIINTLQFTATALYL